MAGNHIKGVAQCEWAETSNWLSDMLKLVLLDLLLSVISGAVVVKHAGPFVGWSNSWAVEIEGGNDKANEIARKHGFMNLGQV